MEGINGDGVTVIEVPSNTVLVLPSLRSIRVLENILFRFLAGIMNVRGAIGIEASLAVGGGGVSLGVRRSRWLYSWRAWDSPNWVVGHPLHDGVVESRRRGIRFFDAFQHLEEGFVQRRGEE